MERLLYCYRESRKRLWHCLTEDIIDIKGHNYRKTMCSVNNTQKCELKRKMTYRLQSFSYLYAIFSQYRYKTYAEHFETHLQSQLFMSFIASSILLETLWSYSYTYVLPIFPIYVHHIQLLLSTLDALSHLLRCPALAALSITLLLYCPLRFPTLSSPDRLLLSLQCCFAWAHPTLRSILWHVLHVDGLACISCLTIMPNNHLETLLQIFSGWLSWYGLSHIRGLCRQLLSI